MKTSEMKHGRPSQVPGGNSKPNFQVSRHSGPCPSLTHRHLEGVLVPQKPTATRLRSNRPVSKPPARKRTFCHLPTWLCEGCGSLCTGICQGWPYRESHPKTTWPRGNSRSW